MQARIIHIFPDDANFFSETAECIFRAGSKYIFPFTAIMIAGFRAPVVFTFYLLDKLGMLHFASLPHLNSASSFGIQSEKASADENSACDHEHDLVRPADEFSAVL